MKEALLTSGVAIELALLGALYKLGTTLGSINSTMKDMAKDIHETRQDVDTVQKRINRHERSPHPSSHTGGLPL